MILLADMTNLFMGVLIVGVLLATLALEMRQ